MKGDASIIAHLNRLLNYELIAANQYFLHAKIFKHWGLERLNSIEYKEHVDELDHADLYANRVLFLGGTFVLKDLGESLDIKNNVEDILRVDLELEYRNVANLRDSISYVDSTQDYVSRDLMVQILDNEEKHIDFLETELDVLVKIGLCNYIQSQLKK